MKFLSNCEVGFINGYSIKRHICGKQDREIIGGTHAQAEYIKFMNSVDRRNCDSADFSISIRRNEYYIRIFCCGLDRVVHTEYVVVCLLAKKDIGNPEWKKYLKRKSSHHNFHIDMELHC